MQRRFFLFLFLLYSASVSSQQVRSSLLYGMPSAINPGMSAFSGGKYSFGVGSRTQWKDMNGDFKTRYAYIGKTIIVTRRGGIAGLELSILNDKAGAFNTNQTLLTFAPDILLRVGERQNRIRFGFQGGIITRKFDIQNLTFENQFTGAGFDPSLNSGENFSYNKLTLPIFNVGFIFYNLPKTLEKQQVNPFLGAAFQNIVRSDVSFYQNGYYHEPTTRFIAHGGLRFDNHLGFEVTPHFFYLKENISQEIAAGLYLKLNLPEYTSVTFEKTKRAISTAFNYRLNDGGMSFYLGMDLFNTQFGFAYDIITNGLKNGTSTKGAMEFCLKYKITGNNGGMKFTTGGKGFHFNNLPIPMF